MKPRKIKIRQRQKTRMCIGWVVLAMVLPVLCACATYTPVEPEPAGEATPEVTERVCLTTRRNVTNV